MWGSTPSARPRAARAADAASRISERARMPAHCVVPPPAGRRGPCLDALVHRRIGAYAVAVADALGVEHIERIRDVPCGPRFARVSGAVNAAALRLGKGIGKVVGGIALIAGQVNGDHSLVAKSIAQLHDLHADIRHVAHTAENRSCVHAKVLAAA